MTITGTQPTTIYPSSSVFWTSSSSFHPNSACVNDSKNHRRRTTTTATSNGGFCLFSCEPLQGAFFRVGMDRKHINSQLAPHVLRLCTYASNVVYVLDRIISDDGGTLCTFLCVRAVTQMGLRIVSCVDRSSREPEKKTTVE